MIQTTTKLHSTLSQTLRNGRRLLHIAFKEFPKLSAITFVVVFFDVALELPLPLLTVYFIDSVLTSGRIEILSMVGFALLGFLVLKLASYYLTQYFNTFLLERVTQEYGLRSTRLLLGSSYSAFLSKPSGYWVARIQSEPRSIGQVFSTIVDLFAQTITFVIGLGFTFYFSARLGYLVLLALPLYVWGLFMLGPRIKKQNLHAKERVSQVSGFLEETLTGVETLKVLCFGEQRLQELKFTWEELLKSNVRLSRVIASSNMFATGIASLAPIGLLWYGGYLVILGKLTLGKLMGINRFFSFVFRPVATLVNINARLQDAVAALERFDEMNNLPKESNGGLSVDLSTDAGISFAGIDFTYVNEGSPRSVFKDFSFDVKGGCTTAIVGLSGCGKSTLLKLAVGLLNPDKGEIVIGDVSVCNSDLSSLRREVCLVPQGATLFSGTLLYNLLMDGHLSGTNWRLPEKNSVTSILNSIGQPLDFEIGPRGQRLSGGQRQRLVLSRALVRDPKILLMDEVTSEIDLETERNLIDEIANIRRGKTTVIVAHRLSAVRKADEIVVISDGQVVERGSHARLMSVNGVYRHFSVVNEGTTNSL